MLPTVDIFGRTVGTYGICAAAGFLCMLLCVALLARRRGMNPDLTVVAALVGFAGAAVGAVLLYGATNVPAMVQAVADWRAGAYATPGAFVAALAACFSGFVFYGGLVGGLVACCAYARRQGWDVPEVLDVFAVAVPLFHVFGRVGCFLGGCCYGVEADWGFVYTDVPVASSNGVRRVPIQLVEAACNAVLFGVLLRLFLRGRVRGGLVGVYGLAYAAVRFVDEFWRGDAYRGIWGPLSTSQWISIAVAVAAACYLVALRRRRRGRGCAAAE